MNERQRPPIYMTPDKGVSQNATPKDMTMERTQELARQLLPDALQPIPSKFKVVLEALNDYNAKRTQQQQPPLRRAQAAQLFATELFQRDADNLPLIQSLFNFPGNKTEVLDWVTTLSPDDEAAYDEIHRLATEKNAQSAAMQKVEKAAENPELVERDAKTAELYTKGIRSDKEVAKLLGITEGQASGSLDRVRKRLKTQDPKNQS